MATTTPNFGWQVPTSTDYVKDGATAIETLGDAIDASLVDLKGGTTGQVLSKATNADMDFTWVTQDDANAIQNTIVDAKGDVITATAADTPARLGVGSNGQVLTADSTTATGLKWASPAAKPVWTEVASGSFSGSSVSITGLSGDRLVVFLDQVSHNDTTGSRNFTLTFNSDTGSNYNSYTFSLTASTTSNIILANSVTNTQALTTSFSIDAPSSAFTPKILWQNPWLSNGAVSTNARTGMWNSTSAITSIQIATSAGSFDNGTYKVWKYE